MKLAEKLKNFIKNISMHTWILLAIMAVGIFLRTYNFHAWLEFRSDQARDAYRTDQVLSGEKPWPLMGPFLSHSGPTEEQSFHVGPIYYYFQIISAKIFGSYPDKLAYPDVFFAILSIPLFYLFLREYFGKNISLGLTGLYSIGDYLIRYSRYAWSCNPIPFSVLLFLFSLSKMLNSKEKNTWSWAILLGVAWGVGFQLHALTMINFSGVAFLAFIFSIKKNPAVWKKWAVVFSVFLVLNSTQIISEFKTDFSNMKAFFNFFSQRDAAAAPGGLNNMDSARNVENQNSVGMFALAKSDMDCGLEANFLYLSSYGMTFDRSNCQGSYLKLFSRNATAAKKHASKFQIISRVILLASLTFSIIGCILLWFYNRNEEDENKRRFLYLVVLYMAIGYLLMLPLSNGQTGDLRYFSFLFFVPFLFLGFITKFIWEKFAPKSVVMLIVAVLFFLFAVSNVSAIIYRNSVLSKKEGMSYNTAVLGEMEEVVNYMAAHANSGENVYLGGDGALLAHSGESLQYLAAKQKLNLIRYTDKNSLNANDRPAFYMSVKLDRGSADDYRKIGEMYVYQVNNLNNSK